MFKQPIPDHIGIKRIKNINLCILLYYLYFQVRRFSVINQGCFTQKCKLLKSIPI